MWYCSKKKTSAGASSNFLWLKWFKTEVHHCSFWVASQGLFGWLEQKMTFLIANRKKHDENGMEFSYEK